MAKRRPSGDGMVRKREDGRWEGRIVVGHKSNGDSIFRYIPAPTQKELSAKLRQLTEAYKGVDLTEESNMSLSVWLDKWLDEYMAATLRPTTPYGRRIDLNGHPLEITNLMAILDGTCYVTRQAVHTPAAVRKTKAALKKAFENAVAKKGTSVVEVVATCNSGWKLSPEKANEWMVEHMFEKYPLGDLKNE